MRGFSNLLLAVTSTGTDQEDRLRKSGQLECNSTSYCLSHCLAHSLTHRHTHTHRQTHTHTLFPPSLPNTIVLLSYMQHQRHCQHTFYSQNTLDTVMGQIPLKSQRLLSGLALFPSLSAKDPSYVAIQYLYQFANSYYV